MTTEQIAAIAARANAATAGPWSFDSDYPDEVFGPDGDAVATCYGNLGLDDGYSEEDVAAFIAGARQDIPALLAHVAAIEAEVERLRGALVEAREELVKTFTCGCWMQGMEADKFLAQHKGLQAIDAALAAKD